MNKLILIILVAGMAFTACKKSLAGRERELAQARIDDDIIQKYIADNNLDSAKRIDTTGVFYIIEKPGVGNAVYTNSTVVTVGHVTKILTTGQFIDSTGNIHPSFILGSNIIKAWQLAIPQIQEGGRVRVLSPSRYAYGPYDQPTQGIPANSVLDFEITLYDVTN